jgi:acyl-CoA reductase-like NAD-dependent aldehyde dehydrogenase
MTPEQVEAAVAAAWSVRRELAASPAHLRAAALDHVSRQLAERRAEVAALITEEMGKPARWADVEVTRAVSTFRFAAEEARRWSGELQRLDTDPTATGRLALVRRVPRGPVLGIAPFNFPLNLVAHKVAPALAVGAPVLVKPAPAAPRTAQLLGSLLAETDLPAGAVAVLTVDNDTTQALVRDPRLPVVSFTGSVPVGWAVRDAVPRKHVVLELGGNAAVVVCGDADLAWAAQRTALFSMYQGGQSCIAVQRVYVLDEVFDDFQARLLAEVSALSVADDVGPLVNDDAADRVSAWVDEAVGAGAALLCGGTREGRVYPPTVLADVPVGAKVLDEEVFGPVVVLQRVASVDAAFTAVNDSRFGLQAGVFTRDLQIAFRAARELEVGGVVVGDVPSYRADQMPYGGMKASGQGREGVLAAMQDLTEEKVLVLTGIDL